MPILAPVLGSLMKGKRAAVLQITTFASYAWRGGGGGGGGHKFTGTDLITRTDPFWGGGGVGGINLPERTHFSVFFFCNIYMKYHIISFFNIFCMPFCIKYRGTRQFIDKTTHRHGFWRQFIDTIEDNPSTLFEDNSSTHYYLAIILKLIK